MNIKIDDIKFYDHNIDSDGELVVEAQADYYTFHCKVKAFTCNKSREVKFFPSIKYKYIFDIIYGRNKIKHVVTFYDDTNDYSKERIYKVLDLYTHHWYKYYKNGGK